MEVENKKFRPPHWGIFPLKPISIWRLPWVNPARYKGIDFNFFGQNSYSWNVSLNVRKLFLNLTFSSRFTTCTAINEMLITSANLHASVIFNKSCKFTVLCFKFIDSIIDGKISSKFESCIFDFTLRFYACCFMFANSDFITIAIQ